VNLSNYQGPVDQLLSLAVGHTEVNRGELLWEDTTIPVDFVVRDLTVFLNYSLLRRHYEARVIAGSVNTRFKRYPSFVWGADALLVLARGQTDISSLTVSSGNSEIHFAGRVQDYQHPKITGDYHGVADLGQIAFLTQEMELRKGKALFDGNASWSGDTFSAQGRIQATDVEWANGKLSTRNSRAFAGYAITPRRIHIFSIKANLFGGELTGDAEINNWQASSARAEARGRHPAVTRGAANAVQHGAIRLQVAGFPIFPGLEIISSKDLPLNHLGLVGNASGNVDILWSGAIRDADTRLNLSLTTPLKTGANEIPLHGQIDLVYKGAHDDLDVTQLHAVTPTSELDAAGSLSANPSLHFTVTSHNVKEVSPLLQAAFMTQNLPFVIHGWATLSGNASGRLSALAVNGNLAAYDFDTRLPSGSLAKAPGEERTAARTVHWDAVSAAVQISNSHIGAHSGVLVHNRTRIRFNASASLNHGRFAADDPFAFDFDIRNADAAELNQVTGLNRPLTGTFNMTGNISGTGESVRGDGHVDLLNGSAYGVDVPLAKSDWQLSDGELQFSNFEARVFEADLSGNAAISTANLNVPNPEWSKSHFRLNLAAKNLKLSHLPRIQNGRFRADGIADFTLRASGTAEDPALETHLHLKNLALDQQRVGDFFVDAVTHGRRLDLNAHSEFEKAELTIGGSVGLEHDYPADLSLAFDHLDADSLLRLYFPGKGLGQSRVAGTLHIRGPLRNPSALKAFAEIQTLNVDMEHVHLQNVDPLRFEVADQTMLLEDFHLAGSGTDFTAHGQAHLGGARELDLRMEGSVNMGLLQSFYPKILARGSLGINLTAQGTMSQPRMRGRLEVKNTFVSHNDFPSGLSDLNGALSFDGNRVQIDRLSGTTGGGVIALSGTATYQSGTLLLDLGATAQDVRLRYPPGVSSTANANLRLTGSTNAALLSGDVVVTKLAITPGFDFGAYIERNRQSIVLTQSDNLQSRLKLDVHVATTPELQMQTAIARLSGNADLRLRGTAERPAILGRVEVLEGEVTFNGTKYNLDRGDVTFANPAKTQPVIDLQATTRVRDYDITVQLRGDASVANGVKVTWQSEPQLPEADVIALLALGRTQEESAAAAQSGGFGFGGDASNLLINEALNSTVNSRLQRLFGASRVKIDPQGLASETNVIRGPQVTIEQEVASKLTLTYSTNVSVSNQQIIQVEYHLTRNVSIVALRDQNGVVSFDFKLRRRKK
jgi:translocation and assembly module TamB